MNRLDYLKYYEMRELNEENKIEKNIGSYEINVMVVMCIDNLPTIFLAPVDCYYSYLLPVSQLSC